MSDDRITCAHDCALYTEIGHCGAASRGLRLDVERSYHPVSHVPRRCEWFAAKDADPDQRNGAQRWPELAAEYEERFKGKLSPRARLTLARQALGVPSSPTPVSETLTKS